MPFFLFFLQRVLILITFAYLRVASMYKLKQNIEKLIHTFKLICNIKAFFERLSLWIVLNVFKEPLFLTIIRFYLFIFLFSVVRRSL